MSNRVLGVRTKRKTLPFDVLVCIRCSEDTESPQNDESIPRGYNIVQTQGQYCYDCGESHLKTVQSAVKKGYY
jgi:hypothetical protein